jgi:hypothetical protein
LTDPQPCHAFVYVCTIQRMRVNLFGWQNSFDSPDQDIDDESDATQLDIPIHAFDVIIADECHRGYTAQEVSKWREVLEYFDAIEIGLTATPASHTTSYNVVKLHIMWLLCYSLPMPMANFVCHTEIPTNNSKHTNIPGSTGSNPHPRILQAQVTPPPARHE